MNVPYKQRKQQDAPEHHCKPSNKKDFHKECEFLPLKMSTISVQNNTKTTKKSF